MRNRHGLVGISLLFVAAACGAPTEPGQSLPTTPTLSFSPSPTQSPSPSPTAWQTYASEKFGFTIDYPTGFLIEEFPLGPGETEFEKGELELMRFYHESFESQRPDGQVELGVYRYDASTLGGWLDRHSSTATYGEGDGTYYPDPLQQTTKNANDRPAIFFDWVAAEGTMVHTVAFLGASHVITLDWWGHERYRPIFDLMLDSYRD